MCSRLYNHEIKFELYMNTFNAFKKWQNVTDFDKYEMTSEQKLNPACRILECQIIVLLQRSIINQKLSMLHVFLQNKLHIPH